MVARRKSRILAMQALYAWDLSNGQQEDLLSFEWRNNADIEEVDTGQLTYAKLLASGTLEEIEAVDKAIKEKLQTWSFERLKKVDLAIMRIAVYAILFQKDVPPQITIDEAVEIAKEYGSDDSYKFVNGILDAIWKASQAQS